MPALCAHEVSFYEATANETGTNEKQARSYNQLQPKLLVQL